LDISSVICKTYDKKKSKVPRPKTKGQRPKTKRPKFHHRGTALKATWNGTVLAESDDTVVVEGNHYFPPDSLNKEFFQPSETHTICPWKGEASYYNVVVDGAVNKDAAWYYPEVKPAAAEIKNRVAFWRGVKVD
jgi:uncharacterized protein (DUF427 family)